MTNTEKRLLKSFSKSSIDSSGIFIAEPTKKCAFNLFECKDDNDIKCKVIEQITDACIKSCVEANRMSSDLMSEYNDFLNADFCLRDLTQINNILGNGKDSDLCRLFVISGYNMDFIAWGG